MTDTADQSLRIFLNIFNHKIEDISSYFCADGSTVELVLASS